MSGYFGNPCHLEFEEQFPVLELLDLALVLQHLLLEGDSPQICTKGH